MNRANQGREPGDLAEVVHGRPSAPEQVAVARALAQRHRRFRLADWRATRRAALVRLPEERHDR